MYTHDVDTYRIRVAAQSNTVVYPVSPRSAQYIHMVTGCSGQSMQQNGSELDAGDSLRTLPADALQAYPQSKCITAGILAV
jgi:hypothetical protein